jgi:O-antigen/teichoic acid export membrane protein
MSADEKQIRGQVNRGLAWVGAASSAVAALDIVALLLINALFFDPDDFGAAAMAFALFPALDLATDLGLASAVVQRENVTEEKLSTLFWLNLAMSIVLAALLWLAIGPGLAAIVGAPIVAGLLGVYGFKLIWQNVYYIPYALMQRELRFRELSLLRMLANLGDFGGKVGFAAAGFGPWAFVAGPLCRVAITGVGIQIVHPWRPRFVLRLGEAADWLKFGFKASAHRILFYLYTSVDYYVVAYLFGKHAAGVYANAYLIVLEPARFISEVVQSTAFPAFSRLRRSKPALVEQFLALTRMNMVVLMGFLGAVFVAAEDILAVIGPEWVAGAPAARILCMVGVLRGLSFVVPPLLDGTGFPGRTLIYTSVAAVVVPGFFLLFGLLLGDRLGYLSIAYAWAAGYPIAFAVLFAMGLAVLDMKARTLLARVGGIAGLAALAACGAAIVDYLARPLPLVARLLLVLATMLVGFGLLLARFERITPRSVARALRG